MSPQGLDKFAEKFNVVKIAGQETELLKQRTKQWTDELNRTVKQVESIDTSFDEVKQTLESITTSTQREYTDNIEKARKEQDKLIESMAKGRELSQIKSQQTERKDELAQAKATNKALEDNYKIQLKNQRSKKR